jgi:hypothetical protein
VAHKVRTLSQQRVEFELLTGLLLHDVLPVPSKSAGLRAPW